MKKSVPLHKNNTHNSSTRVNNGLNLSSTKPEEQEKFKNIQN
jgi:hypothetical protein